MTRLDVDDLNEMIQDMKPGSRGFERRALIAFERVLQRMEVDRRYSRGSKHTKLLYVISAILYFIGFYGLFEGLQQGFYLSALLWTVLFGIPAVLCTRAIIRT